MFEKRDLVNYFVQLKFPFVVLDFATLRTTRRQPAVGLTGIDIIFGTSILGAIGAFCLIGMVLEVFPELLALAVENDIGVDILNT